MVQLMRRIWQALDLSGNSIARDFRSGMRELLSRLTTLELS